MDYILLHLPDTWMTPRFLSAFLFLNVLKYLVTKGVHWMEFLHVFSGILLNTAEHTGGQLCIYIRNSQVSSYDI